jgi:hypothetical protein
MSRAYDNESSASNTLRSDLVAAIPPSSMRAEWPYNTLPDSYLWFAVGNYDNEHSTLKSMGGVTTSGTMTVSIGVALETMGEGVHGVCGSMGNRHLTQPLRHHFRPNTRFASYAHH